jgi:uncharacterized membrane protein
VAVFALQKSFFSKLVYNIAMNKRNFELDLLRGVAVILMVFFHFGYDLALFGYTSYETTVDTEWIIFRGVILSMFLLGVGMSSYLAYRNGIHWKKLWKQTAKLTAVSVVISIGSYFVFPDQWIYFGVIHFVTIATLASLAFLHRPKLSLILGIGIIVSYVLGYFHLDSMLAYSVEHFYIPRYTVDVVSFTPWFGVVLIGIYLMHKKLFGVAITENKAGRRIAFLGKHSLIIYLLHQPVLFGVFTMIKFIR